jgi:hypothetical protein
MTLRYERDAISCSRAREEGSYDQKGVAVSGYLGGKLQFWGIRSVFERE